MPAMAPLWRPLLSVVTRFASLVLAGFGVAVTVLTVPPTVTVSTVGEELSLLFVCNSQLARPAVAKHQEAIASPLDEKKKHGMRGIQKK
jgi:hypothetical protein